MSTDQSWRTRAECRDLDPELFFIERHESAEEAKRVCARCPVRAECLDYALVTRQRFGIWGGMGERQRRQLYRSRARKAQRAAAKTRAS